MGEPGWLPRGEKVLISGMTGIRALEDVVPPPHRLPYRIVGLAVASAASRRGNCPAAVVPPVSSPACVAPCFGTSVDWTMTLTPHPMPSGWTLY